MADSSVRPAEGNPRKRIKIARSGVAQTATFAARNNDQPMASSSAITAPASKACGADCHHGQALQTLHTDLDAMRSLVTCQICHRLLYEPYALSCGHTYCYSCLSQWLGGGRKKTCPDCRTVITQQPTPSYLVRELVLIFVGRSALLPDGETAEEHNAMAKEEAEIVAKDKANTDARTGGLFKGSFKKGLYPTYPLMAIRDPGDAVDRCPQCHWEVEDGYCNQCGVPVGDEDDLGFSDFDGESISTDDELDDDLDHYDDHVEFGVDGAPAR